ncbi:MAG TPA: DUF721 domain-containing protein [Firmicutes bacterium]|mgnify:CR=1 FL=1|jgi:hypothetical protein|nr:DUF721 domain-containing protein [Bacillota bacterium]
MDKFAQAMESYLDKIGIKEQLRQKKWLQKWPDVVGKHICRYAHPLFLKKGVLWVEVSDSNWLYHLTTLQPKIIADYNKIIGSDIIKSMKMINAGNIKRAQENGGSSLNKIEPYPVEPNRKKILLNLHERNRISNLVRSAPSSYRDRFCNLLNHFYLQQKARLESGAIPCRICGLPCYESEMNSKLCPICYRQALGWIETLKTFFHKRPWLSFTKLSKEINYFPGEELFKFCKEKIRKDCFDRIMKFVDDEGLQAGDHENILKRLLLRYIVFVSEKEPALIQPEDEFRALRDFGGLFNNLRLGKTEHNNL